MKDITSSPSRGLRTLVRVLPLAGVAFAVLDAAGDLAIGQFPGTDATPSELTTYYAAHHQSVGTGGTLMAVAAIFLALFCAAIWSRLRDATPGHRLVAGIVLIGAVLTVAAQAASASDYSLLGQIGGTGAVTPEALQATHIASFAGVGAGTAILLLGVFVASTALRAVPGWLAWSALALAIGQFTPFGFFAGLLFLPWAAAAGVAFAARPATAAPDPRTAAAVIAAA